MSTEQITTPLPDISAWLEASLKDITEDFERKIIKGFIDMMVNPKYVNDQNRIGYWMSLVKAVLINIEYTMKVQYIDTGKSLGYKPYGGITKEEAELLDADKNIKRHAFSQEEFTKVIAEINSNSENAVLGLVKDTLANILSIKVKFFRHEDNNWKIILKWLRNQSNSFRTIRATLDFLSEVMYIIRVSKYSWENEEFKTIKMISRTISALREFRFVVSHESKEQKHTDKEITIKKNNTETRRNNIDLDDISHQRKGHEEQRQPRRFPEIEPEYHVPRIQQNDRRAPRERAESSKGRQHDNLDDFDVEDLKEFRKFKERQQREKNVRSSDFD